MTLQEGFNLIYNRYYKIKIKNEEEFIKLQSYMDMCLRYRLSYEKYELSYKDINVKTLAGVYIKINLFRNDIDLSVETNKEWFNDNENYTEITLQKALNILESIRDHIDELTKKI